MHRTARVVVLAALAGLSLTGCAAGLTAGDRAAEPAVVAGGGDGGPGESTVTLPSTSSPGTGVEVGTDGVTAPGWSVGGDGITGPGVSVGPDGIAVDPSAVGTVEDGTDSTGTAETSESSATIGGVQDGRLCSPTDHLVLDRDSSTLSVTGTCGSVTITADDVVLEAEGVGALTVSGDGNSVTATSHTSLDVAGSVNVVSTGAGGAVTVDGSFNTVQLDDHTRLEVGGDQNVVEARGTVSGTEVLVPGAGNTVQTGSHVSLLVSGDDNVVTFAAVPGAVQQDTGSGNVLSVG